jgi:hypothetical protein
MAGEIIKKNIMIGLAAGKGEYKLEDVVEAVQCFCLGMRLEHWKTTSYETHKAVEMTQASMEELLDTFVEACVGMANGVRPNFKQNITANTDEEGLIAYLKEIATRDTAVLNIRDEMIATLYKYNYLKTLK